MSRRKQLHRRTLSSLLRKYADSRTLDFNQFSIYHMRLKDGMYTTIDIWTTGKYYVVETNYYQLTQDPIIERAGEKGLLPEDNKIQDFLDKLFYATDM